MIANLALGLAVIAMCVLIHTIGLIEVTRWTTSIAARFRAFGSKGSSLALLPSVLGIFVVLAVEIWLWALVHLAIGSFADLETALYFSIETFSTLGYGEVIPPVEWRVFSALEGVTGFLLIGWSTAYIVSAGIRIGPFRSGEHF